MNFDRLAPWYPWMERLAAGRLMQRCRTAYLDRTPVPRRVLLVGEGPGRFLAELVRRYPEARVTVVDSSERMLDLARRSLGEEAAARVEFVHGDVRDWDAPQGEYDWVVTHFFLDCFRPEGLAVCVSRLADAATEDAVWWLADFQLVDEGLARWRGRCIVWLLYRFFRATCRLDAEDLTEAGDFLRQAGFELRERMEFGGRLVKSEWWQRGGPAAGEDPAWQVGGRR